MESLNKERNNNKNKLNLSGKLTKKKKTVPPFCGLATILTKTNWTTEYFH